MTASMRAFVDESKARSYLLVAVLVPTDEISVVRHWARGLQLPGQRRVHMSAESPGRRAQLLAEMRKADLAVCIVEAPKDGRSQLARRDACLEALVGYGCERGVQGYCLDRDETLERRDRVCLRECFARSNAPDTVTYTHLDAVQEPLLALPDIVAWPWARGGHWRARVTGPDVTMIRA